MPLYNHLTNFYSGLSLASLIRHSSFFCGLSDDEIPSEVNLAKALRSAGDGSPLEIQMSLSNNRQDGSGLYNIRRKDWELLKGMPVREWTEEDWDTRTAYVVSETVHHFHLMSQLPFG